MSFKRPQGVLAQRAHLNCEDVPESGCSLSRSRRHRHHVGNMKPSEVQTILENAAEVAFDVELSEFEEGATGPKACEISELQDPNMDDEDALKLAMLHSQEETDEVALKFALLHLQEETASSDADQWDLCETTSIASSWLDLQDHYAAETLTEDDIVILKPCVAEALPAAGTASSWAAIAARFPQVIQPSPAPRLAVPCMMPSQVPKVVAVHQADEQVGAFDPWETYWEYKSRKTHHHRIEGSRKTK